MTASSVSTRLCHHNARSTFPVCQVSRQGTRSHPNLPSLLFCRSVRRPIIFQTCLASSPDGPPGKKKRAEGYCQRGGHDHRLARVLEGELGMELRCAPVDPPGPTTTTDVSCRALQGLEVSETYHLASREEIYKDFTIPPPHSSFSFPSSSAASASVFQLSSLSSLLFTCQVCRFSSRLIRDLLTIFLSTLLI